MAQAGKTPPRKIEALLCLHRKKQLAEFGVERPAPQTEEQKPNYYMMILNSYR
jgi:hypothetical protein